MKQPDRLLLGLGNSLRGDDAVGFYVLDYILQQKRFGPEVVMEKSHASGIALLSYLFRFHKIIVVDSIQRPHPQGEAFWKVRAQDLRACHGSLRSSHGYSLRALIDLGEKIGWNQPKEILLFLVNIPVLPEVRFDCNESISEPLKQVIPSVSRAVLQELYAV